MGVEDTEAIEIKKEIMVGNKTYFSLLHMLNSKTVRRKSEANIEHTIIRPIVRVRYGFETYVLTENTKYKLEVFEGKNLRRSSVSSRKMENGRLPTRALDNTRKM